MANLITEKQKKEIRIDYLIRLNSLSLLILSLLGLFILAYVVPYYISVGKKDMQVAEQFKTVINVENKENTGESSIKIISQTSDEMAALELYDKNRLDSTAYFNKIIKNKNGGENLVNYFNSLGFKTEFTHTRERRINGKEIAELKIKW